MTLQKALDEGRDQTALLAFLNHLNDGWQLTPQVLGRLKTREYLSPDGMITDKGIALLC